MRAEARDVGRAGHVYLMVGSREWILTALLTLGALALVRRGARPLWAGHSTGGRRRQRAVAETGEESYAPDARSASSSADRPHPDI
ncbi:hypothetical protein BJF79_07220 [Actinomadura sp. CNU-125]|nr:hypothetical protein BJF79_07220 [Actinomadura sp. CNU-125]